MIIDTSVIVAIVFRERGYRELIAKLSRNDPVGMGTPTLTETGIVLTARLGSAGKRILSQLIQELKIIEVPFGEAHWREAVESYRHYGRGRHAARLNFGDCMTYATAKLARQPLLFVGEDFRKTDLEAA